MRIQRNIITFTNKQIFCGNKKNTHTHTKKTGNNVTVAQKQPIRIIHMRSKFIVCKLFNILRHKIIQANIILALRDSIFVTDLRI